MTYRKALERFKTFGNFCDDNDGWCDCDCEKCGDMELRMIEALEKQIPKPPTLEADGYADGELVYDTWFCPNCDKSYEVDFDDYDFCPNCGQHILWEGEE